MHDRVEFAVNRGFHRKRPYYFSHRHMHTGINDLINKAGDSSITLPHGTCSAMPPVGRARDLPKPC